MKKTICVAIFVIIFSVFLNPLFGLVEGRIEGTVKDKDSGVLLGNAKIQLLQWYSESGVYKSHIVKTAKSDEKGFFSINIERPGEYFLNVNKEGYVSCIPGHYFGYLKREMFPEKVKILQIDEGQIKHLQIQLEKGGKISGNIQGKTLSGIIPLNTYAWLYKLELVGDSFEKKGYYGIAETSLKNGKFVFDGLVEAKDYVMVIKVGNGFPERVYNNIEVKKGQTNYFNQIYDLTDDTGIKGKITINGSPATNGRIFLKKEEPGILFSTLCHYYLDKDDGSYFCRGLSEGKYSLEINVYGEDGEHYKKTLVFEIEKGQTLIKNFSFANGDL